MATVESPCEECEGRRFKAEVLEYTLGGKDIAEVLEMSVLDAPSPLQRRARRRSPPR